MYVVQINVPTVINVDSTEPVTMSDLWQDRKCIVCFLRHFNCRFCKQQIADLNRMHALLETHFGGEEHSKDEKVSIIAIGLGATLEEATAFKNSSEFIGELFIDAVSSKSATKALSENRFDFDTNAPAYEQFRLPEDRNKLFAADDDDDTIRPDVLQKADACEFKDGDAQTLAQRPQKLFFRIGGCFVLGPGNHCDYAYRSQFVGDHAPIQDVLRAAIGNDYVFPFTKQWDKELSVTERKLARDNYLQLGLLGRWRRRSLIISSLIVIGFSSIYKLKFLSRKHALVLCAFVLLLAAMKYAWQKLKSGMMKSAGEISEAKCPLAQLKLVTIKEVDRMALQRGDVHCDCGFVDQQDVSNKCDRKVDIMPLDETQQQLQQDKDSLKTLLKTSCYLREFLAKSHPLVGRKGAVCPFVPGSLRMNAMHLSVLHTKNPSEIETVAKSFLKTFQNLEPKQGRKAVYKSVVLIFPQVPLNEAHDIIDSVQLKLKPLFVAQGLMIGEFHKNNNASGLRNPNFYPLRTPFPSLAIRHIVPTDLVFLSPSKYPPNLRIQFLNSYLKQFVDDRSEAAQQAVKEAKELLVKAKLEIQSMADEIVT